MLAKGPVYSAHLLCQIDSLREQARSHGYEDIHRICGPAQNLWEQACLRRGRYIQHICFVRYTAFASKVERHPGSSHGYEDIHRICGPAQNLWEQACLRRGRYIQHICFARDTAFASKLAPTGPRVRRICGPTQNPWEQACLRRGRYIQHICFARDTAFASKVERHPGRPTDLESATALRTFTEPVGASLLAKRAVHPADLLSLKHCLREQARSHGYEDIHRICGPAQNPWEQACLRRGRYIQQIC
ncbi:Uncharacterised protein [Paucimonas lemoignei]|nr:Uncharacterised protein [Paucimonas lemoignei]